MMMTLKDALGDLSVQESRIRDINVEAPEVSINADGELIVGADALSGRDQ